MLEFVKAVLKMRNAQVQYYKFKTQSNLVDAKKKEMAVDAILSDLEGLFSVQGIQQQEEVLKWIRTIQQVPKQRNLFNASL